MNLRSNKEMEQLKMHIDAKRRASKREAIDYEWWMKESTTEDLCSKKSPPTNRSPNTRIRNVAVADSVAILLVVSSPTP